jgi:hypothetical protein
MLLLSLWHTKAKKMNIKFNEIPPKVGEKRGRKKKYAYDQLEVEKGVIYNAPKSMINCALSWALRKKNGYKFKWEENEDGTFNFWRVA